MTLIAMNRPVRSDHRLERVHMFPGRHLGEQELDRQQAWTDARLSPLLAHRHPGIVHGLSLADESTDSVTVTPGLAVAGNGKTIHLYSELTTGWQALIEDYLKSVATDDPTGVYYLTLSQNLRHVDSPRVEPCQRAEFDPTRDSQRVTVTSVALKRLAIQGEITTPEGRSRIENHVAVAGISSELLRKHPDSVPLALVGITLDDEGNSRVRWVSEATGRYQATPDSGYRVLFAQSQAAIQRTMARLREQEIQDPQEQHVFLRENLGLRHLPAAGQLPVSWLKRPDARDPGLIGLPLHIGLDMIPVPGDRIPDLIHRHLPAPPVDLNQPKGERLRLLLALNPEDYRPDLLDIPPTDQRLEADLFRYQMRAHEAWMNWKHQFYTLYQIVPSHEPSVAETEEQRALERIIHDPERLGDLGLPKAENHPMTADQFFSGLKEQHGGTSDNPVYPYDHVESQPPEIYNEWLARHEQNPAPQPEKPTKDGLVVRYAALLVNIEEVRNQIRNLTSRGGRMRDFLLLQRQQLDAQSASISALSRGLAADNNGGQSKGSLQYSYALSPDTYKVAAPISPRERFEAIRKKSVRARTRISPMEFVEKGAVGEASRQKDVLLRKNPDKTSPLELMATTHGQPLALSVAETPVARQAFQSFASGFSVLEDASPASHQYQKNYDQLLELNTLVDQQLAKDDSKVLKKLFKADQLAKPTQPVKEEDEAKPGVIKDQYDHLLTASKALTRWIKATESRFNDLERKRERKISLLDRLEAEAKKLSSSIRLAREKLDNLAQVVEERKGDYSLAQQLLMEDWQRARKRYEERSRILTHGIRGLWYVRVRSAEVSLPAADPLKLRFRHDHDDLPGCDPDQASGLPESLTGFLETITEIPVSDWAALRPLVPHIPVNLEVSVLQQYRKIRAVEKHQKRETGQLSTVLQGRLKDLQKTNRILATGMLRKPFPGKTGSMVETQRETSKVLSLEEAITSKSAPLRRRAQQLMDNLELVQSCLRQHLRSLSGSLRLTWGQLAEDNRLAVTDVSRWPGLERAEQEDFNRVRTLSELVDWWFRQLADEPSADSRQAMEDMVRATLIVASLGDPEEIIRGEVAAPPRRILPGERLKVRLNRTPLPGTELQLLDDLQQVTAVLSVEDQVADSTEVRITRVLKNDIRITSRSTVIGKIRR
jgi:hypothetical protein